MVKPLLRTKSIGTKVSDEEYAALEKLAQARGLTLGEWCREVMLASANGAGGGAGAEVLMGELVALRTILLNVLFKQANGETITAEAMQQLIDRADAGKLRKARERLGQGAGSE